MRDTMMYFESTSGLFIVHFDHNGTRVTRRYDSRDAKDMQSMGDDVRNFHFEDIKEQFAR